MLVKKFMRKDVKYINENKSITEAAKRMMKYSIGSVLVENDSFEMVGIITERDVLRHVSKSHDNGEKVANEMTKKVITIEKNAGVSDAIDLMIKKKIKKLVVMGKGEVVGIITATDILRSGDKLEEEVLVKLAKYMPIQKSGIAG